MPLPDQQWEIASVPSRALALFLDYLVSALVVISAPRLGVAVDYQFLVLLGFGAIYFGIGNSSVMGGQTLGKRMFGLRTARPVDGAVPVYLSVSVSLFRYLLLYGIAIIAAEVPPLLFRHWEVSGGPRVLELHMLVLLAYTFTNVLLVVFSPGHRGFHDRLTGSSVMRAADPRSAEPPPQLRSRKIYRRCAIGGSLSALAVWTLGTVRPQAVRPIYGMRYVIEHRLPFRLMEIEGTAAELYIHGIALKRKRDELQIAAYQFAALLDSLLVASAPVIHLELIALDGAPAPAGVFEPSCFLFHPGGLPPAAEPCQ